MSKTTEVQIEKSRNLIEGLRRHVREMGERQRVGDGTSGMRGISNTEINEMEKTVAMLTDANAEVDRLRAELTPKVKKMNDLIDDGSLRNVLNGDTWRDCHSRYKSDEKRKESRSPPLIT